MAYSKTEYVFLQGKAKWVRADKVNKWGDWRMTLYPNDASLEKVRELQSEGVKNVLKKDEDGYFVQFKRPGSREVKGKVVGMAPPEVFQADGKTPLRDVLVGNGSDVTVKLEVYTHRVPGTDDKRAKAARWLSLQVDHLIPFTIERDFMTEEQKAAQGLSEQPKQQVGFP